MTDEDVHGMERPPDLTAVMTPWGRIMADCTDEEVEKLAQFTDLMVEMMGFRPFTSFVTDLVRFVTEASPLPGEQRRQ